MRSKCSHTGGRGASVQQPRQHSGLARRVPTCLRATRASGSVYGGSVDYMPRVSSNGSSQATILEVALDSRYDNGNGNANGNGSGHGNGDGNGNGSRNGNGSGHGAETHPNSSELVLGRPRSAPFSWEDVPMANRAQLCAYPDSIGDNLSDLHKFLKHPALAGVVNGLHLLPIYQSSADRGYAPKNYHEIDPKFGTWKDVEALAAEYEVTLDLMVNHVGRLSDEFQDFKRNGRASKFADLFIFWDDVFHGAEPSGCELEIIYMRKPSLPYLVVEHDDGSSSKIWNTFGEDQIDINPATDLGRAYICNSIRDLARRGIKMIRLDAIGYLTKQRGTECFFNEPVVWDYMQYMQATARQCGVQLLAEIHEHYTLRLALAEADLWVYDFCLPMLVLNALHRSDGAPLRRWLATCPFRQFTVLDTHDGVGVPDVEDVMTPEEIEGTEAGMCGCEETQQWTYDSAKQTFNQRDVTHQHNCSFYSSIQGRANWYLLARAIQVFTPGIPMIYYVGMLAGTNDTELAEREGDRYLNRHYYAPAEAADELQQPVVQELLSLLRFRNSYDAFLGEMIVDESLEPHKLDITWRKGQSVARLAADLNTKEWDIMFRCPDTGDMVSIDFARLENAAECGVACHTSW